MVLMTIDHTRDFVHAAAMSFQPEELSKTTAAFLHTVDSIYVCAAAFTFLRRPWRRLPAPECADRAPVCRASC